MFITSLKMRNFMPFKGHHQLSFPEDSNRNVALVFGDNMRGKSSLLNALRWAFYERAVDRYGNSIPLLKLVNVDAAASGEWDLEVAVSFSHDGKAHEIIRTVTKSKGVGTPQRPDDFDVRTTLSVAGQVVRGDQVPHVINQIVPEQISRFFLFDGELLQEYESLLADDEEQGRRIKEAIEEVLGVPALVRGKEQLRLIRRPFDKQLTHDLRQYENIKHFADKLQLLNKESELLEADRVSIAETLADHKRQYQDLQTEIDATESRFAQRQQLDLLVASRKRIAEDIKKQGEDQLAAAQEAWKDLLRPSLEEKLQEVQASIEEDNASMLAATTQNHYHQLRESALDTGECSICLQHVGESSAERLRQRTGDVSERNVTELLMRLGDSNRQARRLSEIRYPQTKSVMMAIEQTALRLTVEETKVSNEIDQLKRDLADFDSEAMAKVRKKAEQVHHSVKQLEARMDDRVAKLEKNRTESDSMLRVINQNTNARDQRSSRIVNLISALEDTFGKATDKLRDDLRSEVELRATEAFKSMTTDASYKGLRINKNYGLTIVDEHGRDVSLRSAGAEQIVALSLIDGLNQTGRSAGPVIMDTPFGRLDPRHRARVLKHLPESAAQVVLFVHEGEVRKDHDLDPIAPRIGVVYTLEKITSSQTKIVKE